MRAPNSFNRTSVGIPVPAATLDQEAESALRLAREIESPPSEAAVLAYLAFVYLSLGRYVRALAWARQALAIGDELAIPMWQLTAQMALGAIAYDLLDYEDAHRYLATASGYADMLSSLTHWLTVAGFLVPTLIARGDPGGAAALLAQYPPPTGQVPRSVMRRNLLAGEIELLLATGRPGDALAAVDRAITAVPAEGDRTVPYLARLRGEVLMALDRPAEAEATLREGLAASEAVGTMPETWRLHAALGRLLRRRRRFAAAEEACGAAQAIVAGIVAELGAERWGRAFAPGAQARIPAVVPTERRAAKRAAGGLTERERAVAALIAQGQSNLEIAATLVLSRRTVEVHVSNIMGKLGVSARAQIAAWAVANRLVSPQSR
jgi:DNA-binding CsgD family transcriptional regulator